MRCAAVKQTRVQVSLYLEASCILLVAMAVYTQTKRLRFQTSVLLYGVYTDKKGKGETIFISSRSGRQFYSKCS